MPRQLARPDPDSDPDSGQVCLNAISDGSHRLTLDALETAIARVHDKEEREA